MKLRGSETGLLLLYRSTQNMFTDCNGNEFSTEEERHESDVAIVTARS